MRILFIGPGFPGVKGAATGSGIGTYLQGLTAGLTELGHECHVLVWGKAETGVRSQDVDGVKIHLLSHAYWPVVERFMPDSRDVWNMRRLVGRLDALYHYDWIEIESEEGIGIGVQREHPGKTVLRVHTTLLQMVDYKEEGGHPLPRRPWKLQYRLWRERRSLLRASKIFVSSLLHADELQRLYPGILNPQVVHLGIGTASLPVNNPPSIPTFLFVGSPDRRKGFDRIRPLLEAYAKKYGRCRAVIVARADEATKATFNLLDKAADSSDAAGIGIEWKSQLSDEALHKEYAQASVFVHLARYESFGYPLVEAASHGLPVVSTRVGIAPELLTGELTAFLIKDEDDNGVVVDMLHRAIVDRARLAEHFFAKCHEHFTHKRMTETYLQKIGAGQTHLNHAKIKSFDRIYRMIRMARRPCSIEHTNNSVNSVHSVKEIKSFDRIYKMIRMVRRPCSIEPPHNSVNSVHSVKEFERSGMNLDASDLKIGVASRPQRYILVKGKAGLGNRLLVLMGSMVYAELTGRKIIIDWRDGGYAPEGQNAFSLLFSSPDPGDLSLLSGSMTVAPAIWSGYLDESVQKLFSTKYPEDWEMDCNETVAQQTTMNLAKPDYEEDVVVRWGWMHDLHLMRRILKLRHHKYESMTDRDILQSIFRSQFKPERELTAAIGKFQEKHFAGKAVIGVHIRFTDRAEPYGRYFPLVDKHMKRHDNGVIFLATDNCEIEKVFRKRYERVVTFEKWFPPAGTPIHRNRQPDKDALSNARAALIELYLLGACDALVFNSSSTFGYVASLLSVASPDKIIDLAGPGCLRMAITRCYRWLRRMSH